MKKVFTVLMLTLTSICVSAGDFVRIVKEYNSTDTLAVFARVDDNPLYLTAEIVLTKATNQIEIVERINQYTVDWYGPDWDGYSSFKSDAYGYCWWTCPEFDANNRVTGTIASGSGTQNHIGLIVPQGVYRITFDARTGSNYQFIIERYPSTSAQVKIDGINYLLEGAAAQVVAGKDSYEGTIVIPSSVTYNSQEYAVRSIGEQAFYYSSSVLTVSVPSSVQTIDKEAFTLVNNVEYSGSAAGAPWGAKCVNGYIDDDIVYTDRNKTKVAGCPSSCEKAAIVLPNSVKEIGDYAFFDCANLQAINVGTSLTTIGEFAFWYSGLAAISLPNTVTSIGAKAFWRCSSLYLVRLPESLTEIKEEVFNGCTSLMSITIPNSVTAIRRSAFYQSGLRTLTIPDNVVQIDSAICRECTSLTQLTIGSGVRQISDYAFYNTNLSVVYCNAAQAPTIDKHTFSAYTAKLFVPEANKTNYQNADYWKNFSINPTVKQYTNMEIIGNLSVGEWDASFKLAPLGDNRFSAIVTFSQLLSAFYFAYDLYEGIDGSEIDQRRFGCLNGDLIETGEIGILAQSASAYCTAYMGTYLVEVDMTAMTVQLTYVQYLTHDLYLWGDLSAGEWNTLVPMKTIASNVYEVTATLTQPTSHFSFISGCGDGSDTYIQSHRLGSATNESLSVGCASNEAVAGEFTFSAPAGTYRFRFDMNTLTATIYDSTTAIEKTFDSQKDGKSGIRKVLRDGQLFILRDGKTYNALGQVVE